LKTVAAFAETVTASTATATNAERVPFLRKELIITRGDSNDFLKNPLERYLSPHRIALSGKAGLFESYTLTL